MADAAAILKHFQRYDSNQDGIIDLYEMTEVLQALDNSWTNERCGALYTAIDTDKSGVVELDEFVEWVCGTNRKTHSIMNEKPLMLVRLSGFESRTRTEIQDIMEQFGPIEEVHHVKGKTKTNSLVLFETEEGARAAFEAQEGSYGGDEEEKGIFRVDMKTGTPLFKEGDNPSKQKIVLSPKRLHSESQLAPDNFSDRFFQIVKTIRAALGEDYDRWRKVSVDLLGCTVREGAKQLRLMSMNVSIRKECKEDAAMWRRTMRLLAKGIIDLMDPGRLNDMIDEFEGFVGEDTTARAESAASKRAKCMQKDDAWGTIASLKGNQNSALSHLASSGV